MAERRCIFCGRLIDLNREALFRLPPDHRHTADAVYRDFLKIRGIHGNTDLPGVCGYGSPESAGIEWENGRLVLVTKTGRTTDALICPSCHSEIFRDTEKETVNTAVFFGKKDSGKTSLILAMAGDCITRQFSTDEQYRYIFNDKLYEPEYITAEAERVRDGEKPEDLRKPAAVYRISGSGSGWKTVCDVMYDVSESDFADEGAIYTHLPFAADASHYVYCIPVDEIAYIIEKNDICSDMLMRLDIYKLRSMFRFAEKPPVLDIALTKLDIAGSIGGAAEDILKASGDELALKNYVFTAYPGVRELSFLFSDLRVYPVSAVSPMSENDDGGLSARLYSGLFG